MKKTILYLFLTVLSTSSFALDIYFDKIQELQDRFELSKKLPTNSDLKLGKDWECKEYGSSLFTHGLHSQQTAKGRAMKFSNFSVIIENIQETGQDLVNTYFPSDELSGSDANDLFFEAIRVSSDSKLILEKSISDFLGSKVQFFAPFSKYLSLFELNKFAADMTSNLKPSIANKQNKGLAVSYTLCQ